MVWSYFTNKKRSEKRIQQIKGMVGLVVFKHGELYNNREEKYLRVVHCEINSLLFAPERVKGYTLYTYPFASCSRCAVEMLQSGISRFVFPKLQDDKIERWGESLKRTISYFDEAKVEWSEYDTI